MADGKHLGKIKVARFGLHPENGSLGLFLTFDFGFCVDQWVCASREGFVTWLWRTLRDSKRQNVVDLVGVPVEVTIEKNTLKAWRVLTEVL